MLFTVGLGISALICLLIHFYTFKTTARADDIQFYGFQRTYLVVYLLAVAGDWLQGPHVYALYESYGMTKHQIELLFIAGFGSSLLFGTFIGSIADKYGRKANCLFYAVLYGISCITKHFANFYVLAAGRFFGGVATSILFSAFESWLVCEHHKRGFGEEFLSTVFAHSSLGNSLVAIGSGICAQMVADTFGYVAPFDLALLVLTLMGIILTFTWTENFGDRKADLRDTFRSALGVIRDEPPVFCLGLIQSFFEGSMYTFVLEWTPSLSTAMRSADSEQTIPHGLIFATFMVAIMIGSSAFKLLCRHSEPESFMRFVLLGAALCLLVPVVMPNSLLAIYLAFVFFEFCVGIFWPAMGMLRGKYVPEAARSTTMNLFRIPLNLIVILVLMQNVSPTVIFCFCVGFLCLASTAQFALNGFSKRPKTAIIVDGTEPITDDEGNPL